MRWATAASRDRKAGASHGPMGGGHHPGAPGCWRGSLLLPPRRSPAGRTGPALAPRDATHGVRFLGVDIRDDPVSADAFIKAFRVPYPSLNDPSDDLALAFRGTVPPAAIPTTLVIDRSGRIGARILGSVSYDSLRALITQVSRG